MLVISEFLCTDGIHKRVFLQNILDIRAEYFEALSANRNHKARWVLVRGYASLGFAVVFQIGIGLISKIIKSIIGLGG